MKSFLRYVDFLMNTFINYAIIFFIAYPFSIALGLSLKMARWIRWVNIIHPERIPYCKTGVVLVSNHPSMADPPIIAGLLFESYLWNPLKYGPRIASDRKNINNWWALFWASNFLIPVDRGTRSDKSPLRMIKALKDYLVILFIEATRTCNAKRWRKSPGGHIIGEPKETIGLIVANAYAKGEPIEVIPVFMIGSDRAYPNYPRWLYHPWIKLRRITVKIGNPIIFPKEVLERGDRKEITDFVTSKILETADE